MATRIKNTKVVCETKNRHGNGRSSKITAEEIERISIFKTSAEPFIIQKYQSDATILSNWQKFQQNPDITNW